MVRQLFSLYLGAWHTHILHDCTPSFILLWIPRGRERVRFAFHQKCQTDLYPRPALLLSWHLVSTSRRLSKTLSVHLARFRLP